MSDTPSGPGWEPDPTGRHDYRYWDGSAWTDNVSDGGVTSTDPYEPEEAAEAEPEPPPVAVAPDAPVAAPPPPAPPPPGPPRPVVFAPSLPTGTQRGRSKGPLVGIIAVAAVAAAVVAFLVLGNDDDGSSGGGAGKSTVEVPEEGFATKKVSIPADKVALITVTPQGDDIDPMVGFHLDPDSQEVRDVASYYSESTDDYTDEPEEFSDIEGRPEPILGTTNIEGPGDAEIDFLALGRAVDVTFVFGDVTGEGGKLDVDIRFVDVEPPEESSDYRSELCDNEEFTSFAEEHDFDICGDIDGEST